MKVYKLEVLVLDFENMGEESIMETIESNKYLFAHVEKSESKDIGEWSDDHPLNFNSTRNEEYKKLFS